jgi:hypothetical protein
MPAGYAKKISGDYYLSVWTAFGSRSLLFRVNPHGFGKKLGKPLTPYWPTFFCKAWSGKEIFKRIL